MNKLTNAGQGQPRKGYKQVNLGLPDKTLTALDSNKSSMPVGKKSRNELLIHLVDLAIPILAPDLIKKIDKIAKQQDWSRSYTIEQLLRAVLNVNPEYDLGDFALILQGKKGE